MTLADALERLPKVELHCHVEGTIRPSTLVDLAEACWLDESDKAAARRAIETAAAPTEAG